MGLDRYDDALDAPDSHMLCYDCAVRLDHHTGYARIDRVTYSYYVCADCYAERVENDCNVSIRGRGIDDGI